MRQSDTNQWIRQRRKAEPMLPPPYRRLRGYAFDPSLSTKLETAFMNEVIFKVPWEDASADGERGLTEGPVGEYLEVVDYDPASGCFYSPVDLNSPLVLAQDGLAPSEGTPQFHQQMVYAVAMTTIWNFERALGRFALWAPHIGDNERDYVPRLRVYPHALRNANAFYSPNKIALLFGYFPAGQSARGGNLPGGLTFTCLSHDIIAHETTHALLDGLHRRFMEPTHPDCLAFHEAFADIVAIFQHFTFPDVLRHEISRTRGDLSAENMLGKLALQFGQATGSRGALRDAIGTVDPATDRWIPHGINPEELSSVEEEPHKRGAILVAAVFDAFLSIYKNRVADLFRIASGGTGVPAPGALHPDLVNRLAAEAAKAAQHILTMCIRALDYCPPVDVTFGDYIRALVTADSDMVSDDDLGYRLALIESFRRRGIYPKEVRTLSVESLRWPLVKEADGDEGIAALTALLKGSLTGIARAAETREEYWYLTKDLARSLHKAVRTDARHSLQELAQGTLLLEGKPLPGMKGDENGNPVFEIHSVRPARRIGPDGGVLNQAVVVITQKRTIPLDDKAPDGPSFEFRGGCTIILDLESLAPRYVIGKRIDSEERMEGQRAFRGSGWIGNLRSTYFGSIGGKTEEPFALLHGD